MLSDMFSPFTQGMDENQQAQLLMGLGARLLQGAAPRVKGSQNFAGIAGDAMMGMMQDSHSIRDRGFQSKLRKLQLDEAQRKAKKAERIQKQQEKVSTKLSGPSNVSGLGADMYPLLPENMPIDMSNPQQKMGLGQDMMNLAVMQGNNPALTKMAGSMMNPTSGVEFSKINPSQYTQESIRKFMVTRNPADLIKYETPKDQWTDPYKHESGAWVQKSNTGKRKTLVTPDRTSMRKRRDPEQADDISAYNVKYPVSMMGMRIKGAPPIEVFSEYRRDPEMNGTVAGKWVEGQGLEILRNGKLIGYYE